MPLSPPPKKKTIAKLKDHRNYKLITDDTLLALVVQRVCNAIHQIKHYLVTVDSVVCFANTYLLDSDLTGG